MNFSAHKYDDKLGSRRRFALITRSYIVIRKHGELAVRSKSGRRAAACHSKKANWEALVV